MSRILCICLMVALLLSAPSAGAQEQRDRPNYGDASLFATVPAQDHPEGIAVDGNRVFISTTVGLDGPPVGGGRPSTIFVFDRRTARLKDEIVVQGEDVNGFRGIVGLAMDGQGRLYAADVQGRILRFSFGSKKVTQETYATIPDLKPCVLLVAVPCSPTLDDRPAFPNDVVFDTDGNLYVTDSFQATIFRIPPGSSEAAVWFQDASLDGALGLNGIEVSPDGTTVYFGVTGDWLNVAHLYRLPLVDQPSVADLSLIRSWDSGGLDGLAFGASGSLYSTLFSYNEIAVIAPNGEETARLQSDLYDEPASIAFDDTRRALLIPNHAFLNLQPEPRRIVSVYVDDRGATVARPLIP